VLALVYSCATRNIVLGSEIMAEFNMFHEGAREKPYIAAYCGGEIFPITGAGGKRVNRFHNQTLCICVI
jgi:hypothetical protein